METPKATIENTDKGNELVIRIPMQKPTRKEGKKMHVVASSGGFQQMGVEFDGKPLKINVVAGYL